MQTLVSLGSPVEARCRRRARSASSLRHTDDPVRCSPAAGTTSAVGAPGSFVAERTADPALGMHDIGCRRTASTAYTETARLLDASTDPRMDAVRGLFDELG